MSTQYRFRRIPALVFCECSVKSYYLFFCASTFFILLTPLNKWAVDLDGIDIPKEKLIYYLFVGHSNMMGYGGKMDTVSHPRVWMYSLEKGFQNAHDPIETIFNSPSPVLPFLKRMAECYPDYYFCGVKITQAGLPMCDHFLKNKPKYKLLLQTVDSLKNSATLGGLLAMFGLVEGISDSLSQILCNDIITMFTLFRNDFDVSDLPCIIGRYEENSDKTVTPDYFKYEDRIKAQIELIPGADPLHKSALTPHEPIPKNMYFHDHHYNENGYALWSNTAVAIIRSNRWDYWNRGGKSPLILKYPCGGECLNINDIVPVVWTYNPDSLSLILIHISLDSGKTWELISGDKALSAEIDTFYWCPAKTGLNLTKKKIRLRIINYSGKYIDKSNLFSIIMPTKIINTPQHKLFKIVYNPKLKEICFKLHTLKPDIELSIYSSNGRLIKQILPIPGTMKYNFSSSILFNGVYVLKLGNNKKFPSIRLVVID